MCLGRSFYTLVLGRVCFKEAQGLPQGEKDVSTSYGKEPSMQDIQVDKIESRFPFLRMPSFPFPSNTSSV